MNLRIARKIVKAVGTPDENRYNSFQIGKAADRVEKTRSSKENTRYWNNMMDCLGLEGRAQIVARLGDPAAAFRMLMRA